MDIKVKLMMELQLLFLKINATTCNPHKSFNKIWIIWVSQNIKLNVS